MRNVDVRRRPERGRPRPHESHGGHLVAAAVVQILTVVVLLVSVLLLGSRGAQRAAASAQRARAASSVAGDLELVSQANVELQAAFERAAGLTDLAARAEEFSTASATGIEGTGAFSTYLERSLGLPGEPAARRAFQQANDNWNGLAAKFGPRLVNASTSAASITENIGRLHILQDVREARLLDLRDLYDAEAARDETTVARDQRSVANADDVAMAIVAALGLAIAIVAARRASRRTKARVLVEGERAATERRTDFEARVQRSMALAVDEAGVMASVGRTLEVVGYRAAEFLVTHGDDGAFRRAIAPACGGGCGVERAADCPAVRLRQRLDFPDADAIDACPYLRERRADVSQCVCIPVTIADQTLAVLRAEAPVSEQLTDEESDWISILARNAGEKISALRVFANSQHQAATDALTGLANRRTLAEAIGTSITTATFAALFADIDHFKDLNDTFGHEVGDDCLRAFARVLERATRPGDLCARYGGEEFVVLLPTATKADAELIAERVQSLLAEELRSAHLAPFTVSIGVASTDHSSDVDEVIRAADHAMFEAKAAGRNRIMVETV